MTNITLDLLHKSIPKEFNVLDTRFKARITSNFEHLKLNSLIKTNFIVM